MHPVESRTGAIRLEDPQRGAMWLQLGNKSMLMSQKLGKRLADECHEPGAVGDAETLKKNPHAQHPRADCRRRGQPRPASRGPQLAARPDSI